MTSIKKVAVVGASGNLGSPVTKALLDAGFEVTAITRADSKSTFPSNVAVNRADFTSQASLTDALKGQDAVVSTTGTNAISGETTLIDAAHAAGVKRFIPSEFGVNTRKPTTSKFVQLMASKKKVNTDRLIELAEKNKNFTWTAVAIPAFFDFDLKGGAFALDFANKKATIVDSGNAPFSAAPLSFVAQAVVAVLTKPEQTANKYLEIEAYQPTQNKLVQIVEELTGDKYEIKHVSTAEISKRGDEKLSKGDFTGLWDHILVHWFGDDENRAFKREESANELLGLQELDLKQSVKEVLATL